MAALLLVSACRTPPPGVTVSDGRYVMGTVLEITLVVHDEVRGRALLDELFDLAGRLDTMLSRHASDSALSRLNAAAGDGPQVVPGPVRELLTRSLEYSALTDGSFDVTVGPLVALWTRAARRDRPPTDEEIAAARLGVGASRVRIAADGRVALDRPEVQVDLGGIAKGYAIDRMREVLAGHGVRNALLNFGQSSVWALGQPLDADAWRLLVRGPGDSLLGVMALRDRALSVSGSLGQWVEIGGERFGHVLDPRTGQALRRRRQALVLGDDATRAEALSKALLVLGEEEGLAIIRREPACEALLVDAEGAVWSTEGFEAAAAFESL